MPRGIVAFTCTLVWSASGAYLITNNLRGQSLNHIPDVNTSRLDINQGISIRSQINSSVPAAEHDDANSSVPAAEHDGAAHYCGCSGSICDVDTMKLDHELQNDLVLFLGCSLDINAIKYFCNAVGSPVQEFQTKNPFSYLSHCDVGKFTVVYAFHPGASPAPFYAEYAGTASAYDVVQNSVHDIQLQFGRQPTAVVVDSSLWDVSNWWQKHGKPPDPYPIPTAEIDLWCHRDVPNLLRWVQKNYPHSGVAFRTAPTVFAQNGYGQSPLIIDEMVKCIDKQKDPLNRLYGRFGFVDYHHFVDEVLQHSTGAPIPTWYKDSLHPGPSLSMMYMNRVLNWVRGLKTGVI